MAGTAFLICFVSVCLHIDHSVLFDLKRAVLKEKRVLLPSWNLNFTGYIYLAHPGVIAHRSGDDLIHKELPPLQLEDGWLGVLHR
jgi:hypothetical protein